ncbi:MAG TPA: YraN family protein [Burkholderiaceae bacterium]|nr:YraN family protein [Burkholderiaceae bacterium]
MDRRTVGAEGEAAARAHLEARGLRHVASNWRAQFRKQAGELDLVMRDGDCLVFVEVRRRASNRFGGAAASVDAFKQAKLVRAAQAYLATQVRGPMPPCRFDVVAIEGARIEWIRDAFRLD